MYACVYLTIPRARFGCEMINSQRGAQRRVGYNHLISNKGEWKICFIKNAPKIGDKSSRLYFVSRKRTYNGQIIFKRVNCLNLHCFTLTISAVQIVEIMFSSFYLEIFSYDTLWVSLCSLVLRFSRVKLYSSNG